MRGLHIGEAARRAGVTPATIRYYEEIGVLPPPPRTPSGYRIYDPRVLVELRFIRRAQALGFALEDIARVLRVHRQGRSPCEAVVLLARRRLAVVEQQMRELAQLKARLVDLVASWEAQPCADEGSPCALLDEVCGEAAAGPRRPAR